MRIEDPDLRVTIEDAHVVLPLYEKQTEDGPQIVGHDHGYVLRVQFPDGSRWIHHHTFPFDEAGYAAALKLKTAVETRKSIDPAQWWETYPEYGSRQYFDDCREATMMQFAGVRSEDMPTRLGTLL